MSKFELYIYGTSFIGFGGETFTATITATDETDLRRKYRKIKRQIAYNKFRKRQPKQLIQAVEIANEEQS